MSEKRITVEECKRLIAEKLHEIFDIYHQYNPDGTYIVLSVSEDDDNRYYSFNNAYWDEDKDEDGDITRKEGEDVRTPLNYWKSEPLKEGDEDV